MLSARVVDPRPSRIRVKDPPSDSPVQDLAQRLGRLSDALRERRPPSADLVGSQLDDAPVMNARVAFASGQRSFAIVRGAASCCAVLLDNRST